MYKIIDNFLPAGDFNLIQEHMLGNHFPWHYSDGVAMDSEPEPDFYFIHSFFSNGYPRSPYYDVIQPLIEAVAPKALIRVKANLFTNVTTMRQYNMHVDQEYPHFGAVFSINSNNGGTILEDGTKIGSVANRMLFFDSSRPHASTSCTDEKVRVNINFNYF